MWWRRLAEVQTKHHRVPLLSAKNRTRRIQFTQDHQNWTKEDWKNVAWSDESWFLLQHSDVRVRLWRNEHESMDSSCLVSTVQTGGGVMVWGIFSWCTLGLLAPIEHRLNSTVYLSIVADHVHPFMTTVYHLLMYFQQDNAPSQSSNHLRLVSWTWQWVHFTQMTSTVTRSQSIEHLWDVVEREILIIDVQTTNLQRLRDDIMTIWTKISEECFQHLV